VIRLISLVAVLVGVANAPLPSQIADVPRARLDVTVVGIRPQQGGVLILALYDRKAGWLVLDSARAVIRIRPEADSLVAVFDSLPYDSGYAVAVIHDRNENEKLDMRWFPFPRPKEGAGVSRNHVRMGKPDYNRARITLALPEQFERIALRY